MHIHSDYVSLAKLHLLLEPISALGNFPLRKTLLNRLNHAAEIIDGLKVLNCTRLHISGELLEKIRAP